MYAFFSAIEFLMEESEDVKFGQVDCMEALDTCTEEDIESFPQIYLYKDGHMEDIFQGERNLEEISNFVWQEVDPSRVVQDDDPFEAMLAGMKLNMGGGQEEEEEEQEEEEEWDECDCSDPECDCSEDEDEYEYEDEEEVEGTQDESEGEDSEIGEEEDEEDEDLSDEEIAHLEKEIQKDIDKRNQRKPEEIKKPKESKTQNKEVPEEENSHEEVKADTAHVEL